MKEYKLTPAIQHLFNCRVLQRLGITPSMAAPIYEDGTYPMILKFPDTFVMAKRRPMLNLFGYKKSKVHVYVVMGVNEEYSEKTNIKAMQRIIETACAWATSYERYSLDASHNYNTNIFIGATITFTSIHVSNMFNETFKDHIITTPNELFWQSDLRETLYNGRIIKG